MKSVKRIEGTNCVLARGTSHINERRSNVIKQLADDKCRECTYSTYAADMKSSGTQLKNELNRHTVYATHRLLVI